MVLIACSLTIAALVLLSSHGSTKALEDPLKGLNVNDLSFADIFSFQSSSVDPNGDIDRILAVLTRVLEDRADVSDLLDDFHDCFVEGLASGFERAGDASLRIVEQNATLSVGITLNRLSLTCSWRRKVWKINLAGTAKASTNKVGVAVAISVQLLPGAQPNLDEFRVLRLENIKMTFTGLGFLNVLADALGDSILNTSRARLIKKLEDLATKSLQKRLKRLTVPNI